LKQVHKISSAFFDSLGINISDPFIIIDHDGEIISYNKSAKNLLAIVANKNISHLFDDQTITKLNDLIEGVFSSNKPATENIRLLLRNGSELNVRAIINSYKEENELFIFCTFIPQVSKLEIGEVTKLKIQTGELKKIISSEFILKIIDEIKLFYPFTVIGKDKISRKVDELDELFWIKDLKGSFVLVNIKLASNLGLKPSQIEGKSTQSFLPAYIVEFYNTIENYIKETLNCTVMQGIPIAGINDPNNYRVIEIPLSDSESNVIAVIGIAQKIEMEDDEQKMNIGLFDPSNNLLKNFSKALAFIDKSGIIKHGSEEFCKLFIDEFSDLRNIPYTKIFPLKLVEQVQQFLNTVSGSEEFELSLQVGINKDLTKNLIVSLNKIFGKENEFEGFSILLEEAAIEDNLERIINKRGRMFEILIQNNPEPIFIYDTENLRFIEANEAALSLYGYRKDEFLQMDLTDLYTPEDIQTLLDSSNMAAKGGKFTGPYKHKKKDGSYIFVEISKIGFKYKEKDAHFNIVRDVTARLELEKKSQLYRTAFDSIDDLLFITDNVGIITFANPAVIKYLGYSKSEIENTSLTAHVKNDDRGTINSSIFQSHLIDTVTISTELKNSEGKFLEVELTAISVLNYKNEVDSFSIIGKLVKNSSVQPEVEEIIKEVIVEKPVVSDLKETEPLDPEFLPGLFHDLLTPINVILGFVQEFTNDMKNLTPDQKEAMEIITQNRNRLLTIMNSVIEYSNVDKESTEFVPEEIGITEIIDQLQNDFNDISSGRDVEFNYGKISSSLKFVSDKQKFQNLVSTLLKISILINKEKKIYFSAYHEDDKSFAISLKDNYSHISEYMLGNYKAIFGSEKAGAVKNLGISKMTIHLAITLLRSLNGKFEVIEPGKDKQDCRFVFPLEFSGSEVKKPKEETGEVLRQSVAAGKVSVPEEEIKKEEPAPADLQPDEDHIAEIPLVEKYYKKPAEKQAVPSAGSVPGKTFEKFTPSSLSCLYIEDQVDSQLLFKVQMKELKEIKFAISFEEALPLLNSYHFDFLVVDINLQGEYNGLDALRIIHKMPGLENIPVIAVTAYILPGDREKFIASGFNDFISKPIFHEKLIDVLKKIFVSNV
jgi:PAS domain S-box-containing protein